MAVSIQFTSEHIKNIKQDAEHAYPNEACGLITGWTIDSDGLEVMRVVKAQNIRASETGNRFEVDPGTRIKLEKEIRGTNEQLIAHYHSHPDNPATPSNTDLINAHEPELIWIIVSVEGGKASDVAAHQVLEDKTSFKKVSILVK
ncbi:MAG TPA: M67 family peptidase [Rhodospirillales bacterium]|jgi:proteasome lid subunit RPN8/RPN11|nr:M67 family peptidase [Rhodospirillales bacterium]